MRFSSILITFLILGDNLAAKPHLSHDYKGYTKGPVCDAIDPL